MKNPLRGVGNSRFFSLFCEFNASKCFEDVVKKVKWTAVACAMLCGSGFASAEAQNAEPVQYKQEKLCPIVAQRPDHDRSIREQIAHTSNGDIAYYRFGNGSPIVLQTGFRATLSNWSAAFLTELAKRHEVIVFDNRGIGRSEPDASSFTATDMAHDLGALIETLQLKDVTVLGWSMGGAIAQQLAIDSPSSVHRVVLMSAPAPGIAGDPVPPGVEGVLAGEPGTTFMSVMQVLFPKPVAKAAAQCFRNNMFTPADYKPGAIPAPVTAGQIALLRDWSENDEAIGALRNVRINTLVMTGSDDEVLAKQNAQALAQTIPDAKLLIVRSGGHAMMYQYPRALASAIDSFIDGARGASQ